MLHGTYQKIAVVGIVVCLLLIYALSRHKKGHEGIFLLHEQVYYNDKQKLDLPFKQNDEQQSNLQHGEVNTTTDKQQDTTSPAVTHIVKIDRSLLNLAKNQTQFDKFVDNLSPSQVEDLVAQIVGENNLTTRKAQEEFLKCAGILTLRQVYAPYPNTPIPMFPSQQQCKKMLFKNSGPVVALSSVPGSGNSWVRQLLESATGIYTGAVYCDPTYVKAGMIGELIDTNNVLAVKLHYMPTFVRKVLHNDKAIYIVRSPFGAILSENNRNVARNSKKYTSLGDSHVLEVDFNYRNNPEWDNHVKKEARAWRADVTQWLRYNEIPVHIVGYENLKKNTYTELKKMLDFLGYPYTEEDLLCAVKGSGENFHRNHTKKDLHPFSPGLQQFVLNEIKQVDAGLLKHGISLNHPYE